MIDYEEVTHGMTGYEPLRENLDKRSTSFSFSLQILTHEGLAVKGDMTMQKTSTVPQRASKPVTIDIEQEYDDVTSVASMPRSAVRFRSTTQPQEPTHKERTTDVLPISARTTHRVSGNTRLLLWIVLLLGIAFLFNGIVLPAINSAIEQVKYGDARIATFDINGRSFLTQEEDNKIKIVVSSSDNQHNQVLILPISSVANHALVTLAQSGTKIEVAVNGTYIAVLVPDTNGYKWGSN